jgi:hypothetical protein
MKMHISPSLFVLLVRCLSADGQQLEQKQQLINLERELQSAYVRHDPGILERVLADDYLMANSRGSSSTKRQQIEALKSDDSVYEYSEPYDLDIRLFGDTAVIVGRTREKGR